MSMALEAARNQQVIRSPSELAPLIKAALLEAKRCRQELANLFAEARESFSTYAEFLSWTHRQFGIGESQTKDYLSIGRHERSKAGTAAQPVSLNAALRAIGRNRPTGGAVRRDWQPDVDAIAERAKREQERIARAHEDELTRKPILVRFLGHAGVAGRRSIFVTIRRRQLLRRHTLDLAMTIRPHHNALEGQLGGQSTVRFRRSERRRQLLPAYAMGAK
jgi:hypothetical protein